MRITPACALVFALLVPAARAQQPPQEARQWFDSVAPLVLGEEGKLWKTLKDPQDIAEFQKIFWARRDPDPATPANEFREAYEKRLAELGTRYAVAGKPSSATDCGRAFMLLGAPDDVKAQRGSADAQLRTPEVWTYRNREGVTFDGGKMEIAFDGECRLPAGSGIDAAFVKTAQARVVQTSPEYRMVDGHLATAASQQPKPQGALALLDTGKRQDFNISIAPMMQIRGRDGSTYVAGIVRGDAAALGIQDAAGKKTVRVAVAAQFIGELGKPVATWNKDMTAVVSADNSFVASWGAAVKPGKYTVKAAVLDAAGAKGSTASVDVEALEFGAGFGATSLLVVRDIVQGQPADPQDPLAAFALGTTQLVPQAGNVFAQGDSIQLLAIVYGAKAADTGKRAVTASFSVVRDGKDKAKAPEQVHENETPIPAVGPISLATYEPGTYKARLVVKDTVAGKELVRETPFEVR
jgi:GWxTD domain-containing protein